MRSTLRLSLLALAPLALAACAHGSRKDCEKTDYYEMGLKDGKSGKNSDRLTEAKNTCGSQGVAVAEDKYIYGRKVGLADYCSDSRAKHDARDHKKDSICLAEKVPPYEIAYANEVENVRAQDQKEIDKIEKTKAKLQSKQDELKGNVNQLDQQKAIAE